MLDRIVPLTPCEKLILDVLSAHRHLGENSFVFERSLSQPVTRLVKKGWVEILSSQEGKLHTTLTEDAVGELMTFDYMPPIAKGNPDFESVFNTTIQKAWKLQVRLSRADCH